MLFTLGLLAACAVCFALLRKKFAWYQTSLLFAFLLFLTFSGELGNTFPVYSLFALLPFLLSMEKKDPFSLLFMALSAVYLIAGVFFQSANESLITFLTRILQFFVFIIILGNAKAGSEPSSYKTLCLAALIVETSLGVYLVGHGSGAGFSLGDQIRLVANSQPITGNIGIALLPVIGYFYFKKSASFRDRSFLVACMSVFLFWIMLSGTRGYILVFAVCSTPILWNYFFSSERDRKFASVALVLLMTVFFVLLVSLVVFQDEIAGLIKSVFRANDLGVRGFENAVVGQFFLSENPFEKLFGIGLGGVWSEHGSYANVLIQNARGSYLLSEYARAVGTSFHNYYANILGLQGVVGMVLIVGIFWKMIKESLRVSGSERSERGFRLFLILFILGYAAMLYFRWSADCGVCEMAMLAYSINLARADVRRGRLMAGQPNTAI